MLRASAKYRNQTLTMFTVLHTISLLGVIAWLAMFIVSRIHIWHEVYSKFKAERDNDVWLVEQCKLHEFYHNMKHHSTLCDSVNHKQTQILLLLSLEQVIEQTYLCGYQSCGQLLVQLGDYLLGRGLILTGVLIVVVLFLPTLLLPLFRRHMNVMADHRMQQLYNRPYGDSHYLTTHPYPILED
jgi:hypothetical protein